MTHVKPEDYRNWTYSAYRQLLIDLLAQGKTTGPNQSDFYLEVAALNLSRMKRLDRRSRLTEQSLAALEELGRPLTFLVISEGWCGDAAQSLPIINWMAEASENIDLRVVLRDENPELINAFLTNGGRSIPKLIMIDRETKAVLADWGPRPNPLQEEVLKWMAAPEPKPDYNEFQKEIHRWYARDKSLTTQAEIIAVLTSIQ